MLLFAVLSKPFSIDVWLECMDGDDSNPMKLGMMLGSGERFLSFLV